MKITQEKILEISQMAALNAINDSLARQRANVTWAIGRIHRAAQSVSQLVGDATSKPEQIANATAGAISDMETAIAALREVLAE
jgi:hypothetical protein